MNFIKGKLFFLINKFALMMMSAFVTFIVPTDSYACGGSYDEWYFFADNIPLDPEHMNKKASNVLLEHYLKDFRSDLNHRQIENKTYHSNIVNAMKESGRKIITENLENPLTDMCRERRYVRTYIELSRYASQRDAINGVIPFYINGMTGKCHANTSKLIEFRNPSTDFEPIIKEMAKIPELSFAANSAMALARLSLYKDKEALEWLRNIDEKTLTKTESKLFSQLKLMLDDKIEERNYRYVEIPKNLGWCHNPTFKDISDFIISAINDKSVPDESLINLIKYRLVAKGYRCSNKEQVNEVISAYKNSTNNDYEKYLLAVAYLYTDRYEDSSKHFTQLSNDKSSQFSELSKYMLARVSLLFSQEEWNGDKRKMNNIDKSKNEIAIMRFKDYISTYPKGKYVNSAQGLIRRAEYLNGNIEEYKSLLNKAATNLFSDDRNSSISPNDKAARVKAVLAELNSSNHNYIDSDPLVSLKVLFDNYQIAESNIDTEIDIQLSKLNNYLTMYKKYSNGNFQEVIKSIDLNSDIPEKLLLARSYEFIGNYPEAIKVWEAIKNERYLSKKAVNEIVAKLLFDNYGVSEILKAEYNIPKSTKKVFLASLCEESIQTQLLSENNLDHDNKHIIIADLAARYLYSEEFVKLHKLFEKHSDNELKELSAIRTAVRDINKGAKLGRAYMNIGYFLQNAHGKPIYSLPFNVADSNPQICSRPILKDKNVAGPYYYYNKALEFFDDEKDISEAKVLHFITMCFKRGTSSASCSWGKRFNPSLTSKDAYTKLHSKYKDSKWAERTRHYY